MRIKSIVTAIAASILAICGGAHAGDWPQFLGPERDAVANEKGLMLDRWPEAGPPVLWTVEIGMGFGGAAIRDGEVYLLDRKDEEGDVLRVLDVITGKPLWSYEYAAPGRYDHPGSRSVPTVDEAHVYTLGGFGHLTCINRASHKAVWSVNLNEKYKAGKLNWGFAQSPLVHGEHVIVSPVSPESPGLVAFNKKTGEVAWESPNFGGDFYSSPILRTVDGVTGILHVTNQQVTFADPRTGKILWTYNGWSVKWPIPAPTVMPDGRRIFITGGYGAGSVMIRVRKQEDQFAVEELYKIPEGCQIQTPVVFKDKLYANINTNDTLKGPTARANGGLACIDPDTGKVLWRTGNEPNFDRGGILLVGNRLLAVHGEKGTIHLIEPSDAAYRELAQAKVLEGKGAKIWAPLALSNGLLVIRDQMQLKCLDLRGEKSADASR